MEVISTRWCGFECPQLTLVFVWVSYLMDDLRHWQLVHIQVLLFLQLFIHRTERQNTHITAHWHLPKVSKLHFGNIKLLLRGAPLFSDKEALSRRGTDSSVSVGSECVAEGCVIDRSFQSWVDDTQCKLMQINPFFLLINEKIWTLKDKPTWKKTHTHTPTHYLFLL